MSALHTRQNHILGPGGDPQLGHDLPFKADAAPSVTVHSMSSHSHTMEAHLQDPLTQYQASLDANVPRINGRDEPWYPEEDPITRPSGAPGVHTPPCVGDQRQPRMRPVPCNLAVRLANRSHGAPLATILETNSRSTLSSHKSLVNMGRHPSIRVVECASSTGAQHRPSESPDHKYPQSMQEKPLPNKVRACNPTEGGLRANRPEAIGSIMAPKISATPGIASSATPVLHETEEENEEKGLRGFFRGVLDNVRAGPRSLSRSSSTNESSNEIDGERRNPNEAGFPTRTENKNPNNEKSWAEQNSCRSSAPARSTLPGSNTVGSHVTAGITAQASQYMSLPTGAARAETTDQCCRFLHIPPPVFDADNELSSIPHLLPISDQGSVPQQLEHSSSPCSVPPETRDERHHYAAARAPTVSSHTKGELIGVPIYGSNASSLKEKDATKELSRNVSKCSTPSTSYSGPVLGVDLDLQLDFSGAGSTSSSPTWFSTQVDDGNSRPTTPLEQPQGTAKDGSAKKDPRVKSMTSVALPSLLPVATASGIVHPNTTTPRLSFFSPSGNMIQPEDSSSSPSTNTSNYPGSPATATSYYNHNQAVNSPANLARSSLTESSISYLPPPRPTLKPMTTPPISTVPLPAHLKHYSNRPHFESAHIVPSAAKSFMPTDTGIKGCDGVIRSDSLTPRSAIRHSPSKPKRRYFTSRIMSQSLSIGMKYRNPHKSRGQHRKTRTLQKRGNPCSLRKPPQYSHNEVIPEYPNASTCVAPNAAHTLRVCFCQPYDGAGIRTADTSCGKTAGASCSGNSKDSHPLVLDRSGANIRKSEELYNNFGTPNVRIVKTPLQGPAQGKESAFPRNARNAQGKEEPPQRETTKRTDSAVSTGTGIRVGIMGA